MGDAVISTTNSCGGVFRAFRFRNVPALLILFLAAAVPVLFSGTGAVRTPVSSGGAVFRASGVEFSGEEAQAGSIRDEQQLFCRLISAVKARFKPSGGGPSGVVAPFPVFPRWFLVVFGDFTVGFPVENTLFREVRIAAAPVRAGPAGRFPN